MTSLEFLSNKYGNQGYKGFFYLRYVLDIEYALGMPLKVLFNYVAKEYNTNVEAVERNIRTFKNKVGYKDVLKNFVYKNIMEYEETKKI